LGQRPNRFGAVAEQHTISLINSGQRPNRVSLNSKQARNNFKCDKIQFLGVIQGIGLLRSDILPSTIWK